MPPYNIQKRDSLKLQNIADMEGDLRNNLSRQELIRHPDDTSDPNVVVVPRREDAGEDGSPQESPRLTRKQKTTVAILCFVNLINYMDRFTVAGTLNLAKVLGQLRKDEEQKKKGGKDIKSANVLALTAKLCKHSGK
ncbi:uncharacterized protein LOC122256438 [Penaeus japonicus]|uniref:uncharacterized protein LOC122256438 n=1 Tax=Penaeus japonicus TaxID=27405 RepID=UPI001C70EEAB|nr:uncharacterized protein LOC122256438 [Penaeus japonicus]